jgi:AraC family transcriptional regulator, transcriptional activator FtrA
LKKLFLRILVYFGTFFVIVGGMGKFGYSRSQADFYDSVRNEPVPSVLRADIPKYDSKKPTVAVVLGNYTTEDFDFLIPYDLFSRTGAFNVFAVAPDKNVKSLTGGLDVLPHYSFQELDKLLGKGPDIMVVPNMIGGDEKKYKHVLEWIKENSSKADTILTICAGSKNLADAGLLKGKSAATHWQIVNKVNKLFPDTRWIEDRRYVTDGNIITSAGQTAGIDAILYVIKQKLGETAATKIANEINYPSYHFVQNPKVEPFYKDLKFATYILNNAFHWNKKKTGVLLYNGMEEMALSSIFDSYSDTGTTKVVTISSANQPIVTKHNLNLLARYPIGNEPKLDKMIVSGTEAKSLAAEEVSKWKKEGNTKGLLFLHNDSPDRFVFEAPLEDLAKQEDLLTANHAVKRLEYRAKNINLEGFPFPLQTYSIMILLTAISVLISFYINRRFIIKKTTSKQSKVIPKDFIH